ncbi:MAG: M23 family metallopeptidase, partial [Myxococcaceae bacterium]|nr:M23 family metallopeptidase [Myxococcaceae bacterium]
PTLDGMAAVLPPSSAPRAALAGRALSLSTAFALAWPVPEGTRISSPFGYREHPMLGRAQLHTGVDLAVAEGTPVHVTHDGVVRRASEDPVNGRVVIVDHGHGVTTAYCHNVRLLVAVGETVHAGQLISESGTTGRSTGPHLHYQLELGRQPTDPVPFRHGQAAVAVAPLPVPAPGVAPGPSAALKKAFEQAGAPEPSATELE